MKFALLHKVYGLVVRCGSYLRSPFLLIIRLYWGWQFFGTGRGKLGNIAGVTEAFAGWGVPAPHFSVILASSAETVCGLLLLLGLVSRLSAIPLIINMIVAYLTAESDALHAIFSDPDRFLSATPFQFLFASLLVLAFGPGAFSLDRRLGLEKAEASRGQPPTK